MTNKRNNTEPSPDSYIIGAMVDLGKAIEVINDRQKESDKLLKASIKANYQASTTEGKKRYARELVKEYGSQTKVAEILGVSPSRISQLNKSPKKNGK